MRRTEIERLLPSVFRQTIYPGSPLLAILDVMSALHEPSEDVLERLETFFNPFRTPDRFVPLLAGWVDLERLFDDSTGLSTIAASARAPLSTGLNRLRALTIMAAYLSQWRGTRKGLVLFLEIATGTSGFIIDESVIGPDRRPIPFHIRLIAPESVRPHRALVERIIESEKPAYVTWELAFSPAAQEAQ
jgi:phage tail-like protein